MAYFTPNVLPIYVISVMNRCCFPNCPKRPSRRKHEFLMGGHRAFDRGDWSEARIQFERYLEHEPRAADADRPDVVRVVGKHCESGDVLVRDAPVPAGLQVGDILGTAVTGAYGHSMGSNYNKVLRPPVVFASGGDARLVVRRETYDDLVRLDL